MKKLLILACLSASVLFADQAVSKSWADNLSVNGSIGYESEYVYRGWNIAHSDMVTSIEAAYKLYNGSLYAGAVNNRILGSSNFITELYGDNETNLYVGYKMPLYDKFNIDAGFTYYWYNVATGGWSSPWIDFCREVYTGVTYDGLWIAPAAYVYYDFDREAWTGELSGKYSVCLAKYGIANTALDLGAYCGGVSANDIGTDQTGPVLRAYP
jgi:hypothetical protein